MKKRYLILSAIAASFLFASEASVSNIIDINTTSFTNQDNNSSMFATDEAIIVFKDGTMASQMVKTFQTMFGAGMKHNEYSLINGMHIIVPGKSFEKIKSMIETMPMASTMIKSIEKNYANASFKSNDTYYDKLWAIENTGQSVNNKSGTADADMDVDEAWKIEKGEHDVVVAVLDTGVDYNHNDLANNMWDGNDKHGYDFAGDDDGNNDNDPMPDTPYDEKGHYHGTHVAGTIGAVGDNSNGVTGVSQNVQIMAVKIFRPNGYGYSSDILEGLDYVSKQIDNGVNVVAINASYGGGGGKPGDSMDQAIQKLGDKGVVFCAAAGNDGKDIDNDPVYPAAYTATNIITVAASDQDDKLASFSNYGKKTVEVSAPGTNILSTYPDNKYAYLQGTSMATPNVVGTVALLASVNPSSSVDDRIKAVEENVDVKSALTNKVSTNGRVNTYKAVKALKDDSNTNNPPVANKDSATTEYETKVTIDVLKNDTDADGDNLTIKSVTNPEHGSAVINNGKVDYTPDDNFSGTDTFSYAISDGNGGEDSATVTITVNKKANTAPKANDDSATTDYETTVTIDVLKNDSDADGDTLTIKSATTPSHGSVKIENGKVKYKPNNSFSGNDSFEYTISDGNGGEAKAQVAVTVKEKQNTAPVAKDDSATTEYETAITIDVLKNDSDADGDTLTIKSTTNPSHGTVKVEDDKIKYTPASGFSGNDSFEYTISDGNSGEAKATVSVTVKKKANTAPKASDDSASTEYKKKVTIDVLQNDTDEDGDSLTIKSVTNPEHGSAVINNGKVDYTPEDNFSGTDRFSYTISDGKGGEAKANVAVTVKEKPNTAPKANDDSAVTEYETAVTIDVLKNDSDADGDSLIIKSTTNPSHGTVKVEDGKIKYTPASGFSGNDSFEYTISDGNGGEAKAKVIIKVKEKVKENENHTPIANSDLAQTKYETKVIIDALKNDTDADGDKLSLKSVSKPNNGIATIKNNKIEYVPNSGFSGNDKFTYTISDSKGAEASSTVEVKVSKKENIPPKATDDKATTYYETAVVIDVLSNDSDADGDNITIKSIQTPSHGKVEIENGKIKYTPNSNFSGNDTFEYTIQDTQGSTDSAKVRVMVKAKDSDGDDKEYHFPIIKDGSIESIIKLFTNFTKVMGDNYTEFDLDKSRGIIKVDNTGEIEVKNTKPPMPEGKFPAGSKLEVKENNLQVQFNMTKNIWFK